MLNYLSAEVVRMKKIGRPRKAQRKINISVNLPSHIVDKIDDAISWQTSRSKWVEQAIIAKLDAHNSRSQVIENTRSETLVSVLTQRQIVSPGLAETLFKVIKATAPTEETVE